MKDFLGSFLTTGGIQIVNILTGILAARLLLPEGRGELAILILWPVLIADLGSFGINTSVAFHSARSDHSPKDIWAGSVLVVTLLSPVLAALYFLLQPVIFEGQRPEMMSLAWMSVVLIPLHLYSVTLISQFQGRQEFGVFNLLRCMVHVSYLGFIVLLLATAGRSVDTFAFSFFGSLVPPLGIMIWLGWKRGWVCFRPVSATVRSLVMYGLRTHVGNVLSVANRRLDQVIISVALTATDLGLYVVAASVEGLLFMVVSTMDLLLFPKIAAQTLESGRQQILGRYFRASLVLLVPTTVILLIFTSEVIETVFGHAYLPATTAAQILILTGIPYTLKVMLATYMRGSNRMKIVTKSEGFGIVVTVVSLAALVPTLGLIGAAIAQLLAFTIPALFMAYLIRRETELSLRGLLRFEKRDLSVFNEIIARYRSRERG